MEVALVCQDVARVFWLSGPTHGGPTIPSLRVHLAWYSWHQTSSTALSAWQRSFGLENLSLPPLGDVAKCSVLFGTIDRVCGNLDECHQVYC
jgi:hypothetical protein